MFRCIASVDSIEEASEFVWTWQWTWNPSLKNCTVDWKIWMHWGLDVQHPSWLSGALVFVVFRDGVRYLHVSSSFHSSSKLISLLGYQRIHAILTFWVELQKSSFISSHCLFLDDVSDLLVVELSHHCKVINVPVGNLVVFLGVAMDAGLAGTGLVPVSQFSARTSSCGQGRIIPKIPMSWLATTLV